MQIGLGPDLAGRMTLYGQGQIIPVNTETVVTHPDQSAATGFNLHPDVRGPGIHTVLQQLLDYRCRSFNYLAGRDLTGQCLRQDLDTVEYSVYIHTGMVAREGFTGKYHAVTATSY